MKKIIAIIVLALGLAACADAQQVETGDVPTTSTGTTVPDR